MRSKFTAVLTCLRGPRALPRPAVLTTIGKPTAVSKPYTDAKSQRISLTFILHYANSTNTFRIHHVRSAEPMRFIRSSIVRFHLRQIFIVKWFTYTKRWSTKFGWWLKPVSSWSRFLSSLAFLAPRTIPRFHNNNNNKNNNNEALKILRLPG